jgi:hypothetical protein
MNLIQAVKKGKYFRRKKIYKNWFFVDQEDNNTIKTKHSEIVSSRFAPREEDILADDWEIKNAE